MYGKKDLKAKLLYVGLTKMCVGRFLFFLSQILNQRTNVVLAYNIVITKFTLLVLICMRIADLMKLINFNWVDYLLVCLLPSTAMILWLVIEYVKFRINGE